MHPLSSRFQAPTDNKKAEEKRWPNLKKDEMWEFVLSMIGERGRWQYTLLLLLSISFVFAGMHGLIYGEFGAIPDSIRCHLPKLPGFNESVLRDAITPVINGIQADCTHYEYRYEHRSRSLIINPNVWIPCQSWANKSHVTVAMHWNLACNTVPWLVLMQSGYMIGAVVGRPFFAIVSEVAGRKSAMIMASWVVLIASAISPVATTFIMFVFLRGFIGFGITGLCFTAFNYALENMSSKLRVILSFYFHIPFAVGCICVPIVSYLVMDWRSIQMFISLPTVLSVAICYSLSESPYWLIRKGRLNEAEEILREAAEVNQMEKSIPSPHSFQLVLKDVAEEMALSRTEEGTQFSRIAMFVGEREKWQQMKFQFWILCLLWVFVGIAYYGLALNAYNLEADVYVYMLVGSMLEIPAYLITPHLMERVRRITLLICLLLAGGVFAIFSTFSNYIAGLGLILLSKCTAAILFPTLYVYTYEWAPTNMRTVMLLLFSTLGSVGATLAPLIVDLLGAGYPSYPSVIIGAIGIACGSFAAFLFETRNEPLVETIDEAETRLEKCYGKTEKLTNLEVTQEANRVSVFPHPSPAAAMFSRPAIFQIYR